MNNIIAINVLNNNSEIINPNGTPILFYWDGTSDIIEQIKGTTKFREWLSSMDLFTDPFKYVSISINYISFKDNDILIDGDEETTTGNITLQNMFSLTDTEIAECSKPALNHLYKLSYDIDFTFNENNDFAITIYDKIKEKYGDKLSKLTFINGLRNYYQSNIESLSSETANRIIKYVENKLIYKD